MTNLKEKIIQLRNTIRYARDQIGDDRCWLDYFQGYALLADIDQKRLVLPDKQTGMEICTSFYEKRKTDHSIIPRKIMPKESWDTDLEDKSRSAIELTLNQLERAVRTHRDTPITQLKMKDDRALYALLPEAGKVPIDFRLPPRNEFLGTKKDCAGCPNFWRSHESCTGEHNPHAWGPCNQQESV
jgi:hypothetical protein